MFDRLNVLRDIEPRPAALNMAVDEALLETAACPTLRSYLWIRSALSFGYFGSFAEVSDQALSRDIVRRWTGGGVVPHGEDFTYSVIIPKNHSLFAHSSPEIYSIVHDAIRQTLEMNGIESALADAIKPKVSEHCFANPVRADVLVEGRKIAGAAHRRSRAGLLHQGSIQIARLPPNFINDFAGILCHRFERQTLSPTLLERAATIAQTKYGTRDWLMRR